MKRAIISDIHSNLEALTTVMADIEKQKVDSIICLGDIVGYGPNPRECLDIIRSTCSVCIMGNHDHGAIYNPDGFNACAEQAIFWTLLLILPKGCTADLCLHRGLQSVQPAPV